MKNISFIILLLAVSLNVSSQNKINKGIYAYNSHDYKKAFKVFDRIIKDSSYAKRNSLQIALYYKGIYKQKSIQEFKIDSSITSLKSFENLILNFKDANKYLKQAAQFDSTELIVKIDSAIQKLGELAIEIADLMYNEVYSIQNSKTPNTQLENEYSKKAITYYEIATEILPDNYDTFNYLGYAYSKLSDETKELQCFYKAIKLYDSIKPKIPNIDIGYTYINIAVIELETLNNVHKSIEIINKGRNLLNQELDRYMNMEDEVFKHYRLSQYGSRLSVKQKTENIIEDLTLNLIDIYSHYPKILKTTLLKYDKDLIEKPNDYDLHFRKALLLHQTGNNISAIEEYKKVIFLDSTKFKPWVNLGLSYENLAIELHNKTINLKKDQTHFNKLSSIYRKATSSFENAFKISPCDSYIFEKLSHSNNSLEAVYQKTENNNYKKLNMIKYNKIHWECWE